LLCHNFNKFDYHKFRTVVRPKRVHFFWGNCRKKSTRVCPDGQYYFSNLIYVHRPIITETIYSLHTIHENSENRSEAETITHRSENEPPENLNTQNYLLIDVRDDCEFSKYHIESSVHFPTFLFRQDKMPANLYNFRNKKGHFLIVCADDEQKCIEAAMILVKKYCDNVYILSNSVKRFLSRYTDFAEGSDPPPPEPLRRKIWNPRILKRQYMSGNYSTTSSMRSTATTRSWKP